LLKFVNLNQAHEIKQNQRDADDAAERGDDVETKIAKRANNIEHIRFTHKLISS